jgi:hypothetical protein
LQFPDSKLQRFDARQWHCHIWAIPLVQHDRSVADQEERSVGGNALIIQPDYVEFSPGGETIPTIGAVKLRRSLRQAQGRLWGTRNHGSDQL